MSWPRLRLAQPDPPVGAFPEPPTDPAPRSPPRPLSLCRHSPPPPSPARMSLLQSTVSLGPDVLVSAQAGKRDFTQAVAAVLQRIPPGDSKLVRGPCPSLLRPPPSAAPRADGRLSLSLSPLTPTDVRRRPVPDPLCVVSSFRPPSALDSDHPSDPLFSPASPERAASLTPAPLASPFSQTSQRTASSTLCWRKTRSAGASPLVSSRCRFAAAWVSPIGSGLAARADPQPTSCAASCSGPRSRMPFSFLADLKRKVRRPPVPLSLSSS